MKTQTNPRILLIALLLFATLILTGCVKGEITMDVNDDGSGWIGIALGATQEAKSMLELQGLGTSDGIKGQLEKLLINQAGSNMGLKFDTWVDGEYEWVKVEKEAATIEELNQLAAQTGLFTSFALTRETSFFQNKLNLEAVLQPPTAGLPDLGGFALDTSAVMQMQFALHLPGTITETNGTVDPADSNRLTWSLTGNQPVSIKAASLSYNWLNIGLVAGAAILAMLLLAGLAIFAVVRLLKKPA